MEQARRFLGKAMKKQKSWDLPNTINTDKNAVYGAALESMRKSGKCEADIDVNNVPISASDPSGLQNVVDYHGHQTLMGTELFENVTGAPHIKNVFGAGCVAVAGFYLGINPGSLPESPHSGLPSGSTHCWWG